ncbi:MAG: DUF4138 domain-containing protein [Bacteroidota bacterium]
MLTKDQHFYSFYVMYLENPQLNYFITQRMATKVLSANKSPPVLPTTNRTPTKAATRKVNLPVSKTSEEQTREKSLYNKAVTLLSKPRLYNYLGARHGDIQLKVTGIYHSLENCFLVYEVRNKGPIPYDISYVEFGIKERRRPKKAARHKVRLNPLFTVKADINRVLPHQVNEYVAVFDKITVPNDRLFYMEVVEDGRNITLDILFHKLPIARLH